MWALLLRNRRVRRWLIIGTGLAVIALLTIPGAILAATAPPPPAAPACGPNSQGSTGGGAVHVPTSASGLDSGQLRIAAQIVAAGRAKGIPALGITAALMAGLQESTLRNLNYGDIMPDGQMSSSRGVFQMLAGTAAAAGISNQDVAADIDWWFTTLLNVPNWQRLTPDAVAQAVELSGNPDAYAKWQPLAEQLLRESGGSGATTVSTPAPCNDPQVPAAASAKARIAIKAALAQQGLPYCWGGGGTAGPTAGDGSSPGCSNSHPGFDCSGLMQYAWAKAGVALDRTTAVMVNDGPQVTHGQLQPGDLIFPDPGHVVMYLGNDRIVEAPHDGVPVHVIAYYGMWRAIRVDGG